MQIREKPRGRTARVWVMHGVVEVANPDWISHFNFLTREKFEQHLKTRPAPYVGLASALNGHGDALTIDDATGAAQEAALLARQHGHQVTLFVNPHNVATQSPHFFALLAVLLDRAKSATVTFLDRRFELDHPEGRWALRQHVKRQLLTLASEAERCQLVEDLARALGVDDRSLPRFFQTLGKDELRALSGHGVQIGNHGWTHACLEALPPAAAKDEIARGRRWIEENLTADGRAYAVPFGSTAPAFEWGPELCESWLLNDPALPEGDRGNRVYNRKTLKV